MVTASRSDPGKTRMVSANVRETEGRSWAHRTRSAAGAGRFRSKIPLTGNRVRSWFASTVERPEPAPFQQSADLHERQADDRGRVVPSHVIEKRDPQSLGVIASGRIEGKLGVHVARDRFGREIADAEARHLDLGFDLPGRGVEQ